MSYEQTVAVTSDTTAATTNVHLHVPKLDITMDVGDYMRTKARNEAAEAKKKAEAEHERMKLELEIANDPEDAKYRIKDRLWAQKIGLEFVRHYPGHGWEVHVDIRNGIVNVFNRHMSALHGWRMKTSEIHLSSLSSHIKAVGGEILERFGLRRDKFDADAVRQIQSQTKGNHKADLS
jgi:hypothetical protein